MHARRKLQYPIPLMPYNPNPINPITTNILSPGDKYTVEGITDEHGKLIQHTCAGVYVHDDPEPHANGAAPEEQTIPIKPKKKPSKKKPTTKKTHIKPKRLLAGLLSGQPLTPAALAAGYTPQTAHQQTELLKTLTRQYGLELADRISPETFVNLLVEGTQATAVEAFLNPKNGQVVYSVGLPDYRTRREYLELISRVLGLVVRNVQVSGTGPNGEIELSVALSAARQRLAQADAESAVIRELPPKPTEE